MGLPMIHLIIAHILSFAVASKTDGVGHFQQYGLAPAIAQQFKTRLAGVRGEVREVYLKRMPWAGAAPHTWPSKYPTSWCAMWESRGWMISSSAGKRPQRSQRPDPLSERLLALGLVAKTSSGPGLGGCN